MTLVFVKAEDIMTRLSDADRYSVTRETMAVCFLYLVKRDLSSVQCTLYISEHWKSHFLQGTRTTRPILTDRVVYKI